MATMKTVSMAIIGAAFIALGTGRVAQAVTFTFDELPPQPVDNLSFQGVTFDFKVDGFDSTNAIYNAGGPGNLRFVNDPSLEGSAAGILTLDFATAISTLQFGVALSTFESLTPGFTVELFNSASTSLGITSVDTTRFLPFGFTEGLFTYSGTPATRAVIDFNETVASRFALDNLIYEPAISTPVPEPGSLTGLLALGAFGVASGLLRKQQHKSIG
ncbi:PEP-CTERM sorting domain-containing protein [Trichocoleus sp. FACHB-90]|uniref:PEP-CTERM sorting domain-containing protein n=1 Tax=Cyanophyceae TaxID=3028117 RepID=UPI001689C35F|nr:PEP-CTERM sorting domain-containing protein [Trichocoleus sp. FACHB-90]MBD1929204.1 PEP-CTERM sorting domain-containing protein [Trichocoleus sp. FACHB-90]